VHAEQSEGPPDQMDQNEGTDPKTTTTDSQVLDEVEISATGDVVRGTIVSESDGGEDDVASTTMITAEAFRMAASNGDAQALRQYMEVKPELSFVADENGWLPFHEASLNGHYECVKIFLEQGAVDVNIRTSYGEGATALWWAMQQGFGDDSQVVQLLQDAGGMKIGPHHPRADTTKGHAAVSFVADDIRTAAYAGDNDKIEEYLAQRPDWVNEPDENGWAAIHECVREGHVSTLILLVERGGDFNARTGANHDAWSPLAMARDILGEDHEMVRVLRQLGALDLRP